MFVSCVQRRVVEGSVVGSATPKDQSLLLDAVGPLSFILEEARKGQLPPKATLEAAQTALCLLGNASANISR